MCDNPRSDPVRFSFRFSELHSVHAFSRQKRAATSCRRRVKNLKATVTFDCSLSPSPTLTRNDDDRSWPLPPPSPILRHLQPPIHSIPAPPRKRMIFGSPLSLSPSNSVLIPNFYFGFDTFLVFFFSLMAAIFCPPQGFVWEQINRDGESQAEDRVAFS